jgi:hypothetical protein
LSIAVMAMSNLPSIRFCSWNAELGVGVIVGAMPCFAKNPFSCATQIGQLNPPGKTITLTGFGGPLGASDTVVQATSDRATNSEMTMRI